MRLIILVLIGGILAGCTRPEAPEQISGDRENAAAFISDGGNESVEEESLLDYGTFLSSDSGEDSLDATNKTLEDAAYEREMMKLEVLLEAALSVPPEDDEDNVILSTETGKTYDSYLGLDKTIEMLRALEAESSNTAHISGDTETARGLTYGTYSDTYIEGLGVQEAHEEQKNDIDIMWKELLVEKQEAANVSDEKPAYHSGLTYGKYIVEEGNFESEEEAYERQSSEIDTVWKNTLIMIREEENATEEDVSEAGGTFLFVENPYIIVDGKGQGIRRTRGKNRRIIDTCWENGKIAWQKGYYGTGTVWYEQTYLNDKVHGIRKEYDMEGKLIAEISYASGKRHGPEKKYYKDGTVTETLWENERVTAIRGYYPSGALRSVTPYLNDKKNGIYKEYSEKGEIVKEIPYLNNKSHGTEIQYYRGGSRDGHITKKQWKENVILSYKGYYPSGDIWFDKPYKNGKPHGTYIIYHRGGEEDGRIQKINYNNGVIISYKGYYPSGAIWFEKPYMDGELHGTYMRYDEKGILMEEAPYIRGVLQGIVRKFYVSGDIKREAPYINGKISGITKDYDEKGQVTEKFYKNGREIKETVYRAFPGDMLESPPVHPTEEVIEIRKEEIPVGILCLLLLLCFIFITGGVLFALKTIRERKAEDNGVDF